MSRTTTLLEALLISVFVLLGVSHAGNVSAGTNVWTSYGPEGGTINALAIDPLTPTILYVGTEGGGVFKSADGGDNWSAANVGLTSPRVRALAHDPLMLTTLYAGTWSGGVFKSTNSGASWNAVNIGLTNTNIRALVIDSKAPIILYAGTVGDGVFKSTNGGESWSAASDGLPADEYNWLGAMAIDPATPNTLYVGISDDVFKSTNGGETWSPANIGLPAPNPVVCEIQALAIDPVTPTTLYVGTWTCGVFKSTDGGGSWSAANPNLWGVVHALAIDPVTGTLYAGTDYGVSKSSSGGENWTEVTTGLPAASQVASLAIDLAAPATVYAGLYYGGVAKSTEGGDNWRAANTGLTATVASSLAIDPKTPSILYAGVDNGGVYKSTDSGRSWRAVNNGVWVHTYFHAVAIDPATPGTLYAANPHDLYRSTDSGESWQTLDVDPSGHPWHRSIAIDPLTPNTLYVGTWGEGVFKSVNGGNSWSAMNAGLPDRANVWSLAIDPATPTILYAGMYGQGVFKSMDSGESWRSISNGLFDGNVVAVAIDPAAPTILYAGTWFGGVFKSVDGGENWSEINVGLTETAIRSLAIDPATPSTLYVGTTSGVFKSTNGGANWITFDIGLIRSAVRSLAIDPMTPTTIYAGTEGGGVFEIQQVELKHRTYLPLVFAQTPAADSFWADRYQLDPGECTTLHWAATNAQAVYLNDQGVAGQGSQQVCPAVTQTYGLRVVRAGGTQEYRRTIVVGDWPGVGVDANGHFYRGNPKATVKLEEFMDFQCPYGARHALQTGPRLYEAYIATGEVLQVFHNFPLGFHPNALPAAKAAYCAGQQAPEHFWSMYDWLFKNQETWGPAADASVQFRAAAVTAGAEGAQYDACIADPATEAHIGNDVQGGATRGVSGTPHFFIDNCRVFGAQPFEQFQETIEKAKKGLCQMIPPPQCSDLPLAAHFDADPARPGFTYDGSPTQGAVAARLVLISFEDFKSAGGVKHARTVEPVLRSWYVDPGQLRLVYAPFAHIAPQAATAALCAAWEGKFGEYRNLLYQKQAEWQEGDDQAMLEYASSLGLDVEVFGGCLRAGKARAAITCALEFGQEIGVPTTPSFLLIKLTASGEIEEVKGFAGVQTLETFVQAIRELTQSSMAATSKVITRLPTSSLISFEVSRPSTRRSLTQQEKETVCAPGR